MREEGNNLSVYTLGRFAVVRDGQPLSVTGKAPHKPLELLQALIALGGRDVSTVLLERAIWPEQRSADPRSLFDNTLYRLRGLLGPHDALVLGDGKLSLNPQRCWVDAWTFDRMVGVTLGEATDAGTATAADAMKLYQGYFLQREAPHPWLLACRDRLHSRFTRLLRHEGERLEALQRWNAAGDWYERGLEIDPLIEHLYRRLMICHQSRGQEADAMRVYRRCRELLWTGLGVAPSSATEAIASTIDNRGVPPPLD